MSEQSINKEAVIESLPTVEDNQITLTGGFDEGSLFYLVGKNQEQILAIEQDGTFWSNGKEIGKDQGVVEAFRKFLTDQGYPC